MIRFSLVLLSLILFSCNNSKKDIITKISGDSGKYWDLKWSGAFDQKITNGHSTYCYYFDKNGKFRIYQYENSRRVLYDGGDIVIPDVWSYVSDSTVMIATAIYKIEKLTPDTFMYSSPEFGRKMLVKSSEQSTALDTIIEK